MTVKYSTHYTTAEYLGCLYFFPLLNFHELTNVRCFSLTHSLQSLSRVRLFATPWIAARQASLSVHHQIPEFTQTRIHWVSDAIQPSHPLSSPSPPAPNSSQHQTLFQWVNSLHVGSKYWSFSFSIIPSKEIPELISFRIWLGHLFAPWFQASHLISLGIDFLTYEMELTIWQSCNIIAAIKWHK